MVYGNCLMCNSNLYAAAYCKLICVNLWRNPVTGSGFQDAGGIGRCKETVVAENINKIGQWARCLDSARHDSGGPCYCG